MLQRSARARRAGGPKDQGVAMVMVIGSVMALTLLLLGAIAYASNGQAVARGGQDSEAALAAANAGVEDYLARLNDDGNYWQYGDAAAAFSSGSTLTLPSGTDANPAFSGFTSVPGSSSRASYRYAVNNGTVAQGSVLLQSTGTVGENSRTVQVSLGRTNFLDYLYFTDYEVKDPATYSTAAGDKYNSTQAAANCNKRLYEGRKDNFNGDATTSQQNQDPGCSVIRFGSTDVVSGPMHSNDAIYVCGAASFLSSASTSYTGNLTSGRRHVKQKDCGTTAPNIPASGNDFSYREEVKLPPSNSALAQEVDPAYTDGDPGCLYTGPTKITFNAGGTMNVASPWSKNGGQAWCGTGTNRPLPAHGVIWVRDVPAAADAYSQASPSSSACLPAGGTSIGYPITGDTTPYGCRKGDVFVQGQLLGQLTVGSANNIVVTDDLTYATSGCATSTSCLSVLGLVANNYVEVYHPVKCATSNSSACDLEAETKNMTIEAAILAVGHSFRVQNYGAGANRGNLTIRGAIGQKFRGPVGTGNATTITTGYRKDYNYDWRLRYVSPPHFIDPVASAYEVQQWSEQTPAYPAP